MTFGDFAAQPPELISGRIYAGPGAGSLLSAATAWEALAGELQSTAASYASVVSGLASDSWLGPSAETAAAAAAPYVTWMSTTAIQAEEAATQARAAASAVESVLAAAVPPPVIAANRNLLAGLTATNIFGQNAAAIAATEAGYAQMWAQDVAAMFGYAGSSAAATRLTSFTAAPATTSDGEAGQAAAVAAAGQNSATSDVNSMLHQILNAVTSFNSQYNQFWQGLIDGVSGTTGAPTSASALYESSYAMISTLGTQATWTNAINSTQNLGISQFKNFYKPPTLPAIPTSALGAGLTSAGPGSMAATASATMGTAPVVQGLSVPPSWASASPSIRLASTSLAVPGVAAAPAVGIPGGGLFSEGALGSLTGGALGSPAAHTLRSTGVIQATTTTGARRQGPVQLHDVIEHLQQQPDVVQHWNVDQDGLDELVAKLSLQPGIHAVHVCEDGAPV